MTTLDEIKDTLWLYSTSETHSWTLNQAHAELREYGDAVIDGLIWGLQQPDRNLNMLVLGLFEFFPDASRAFSAIQACISNDTDRLARLTAMSTLHKLGDTSDELIRLLTPRLDSEDVFERLKAAGNLWRINRSEKALAILKEGDPYDMAQDYLDEIEFPIREELPEDREAIHRLHQKAFGGDAEADLVDALRDDGHSEVSMVVTSDEQVIGHILFSRVSIVTEKGTVNALSLAPMAIHPDFQRRGIGTRLLYAGLDRCEKLRHRIVLVLGHPEFYGQFAFSAKLAQQIESPFGGGEAWMAMELVENALRNVVGRVEFSPPFMALL
ncbi:GNAT family N-acetyltransferase [Planctomicrobium sp. SH527]|uniref:GNAT family N-acetyltransferase n=1 Tax=Planctomicrobium sp. SH527 TaxID=3448123 RepID=UPI003F5BEB53